MRSKLRGPSPSRRRARPATTRATRTSEQGALRQAREALAGIQGQLDQALDWLRQAPLSGPAKAAMPTLRLGESAREALAALGSLSARRS